LIRIGVVTEATCNIFIRKYMANILCLTTAKRTK
jgi:hypothetical protein